MIYFFFLFSIGGNVCRKDKANLWNLQENKLFSHFSASKCTESQKILVYLPRNMGFSQLSLHFYVKGLSEAVGRGRYFVFCGR